MICIISTEPEEIVKLVEKTGHTIILVTDQLKKAAVTIIKESPHFVLVDTGQPSELVLLVRLKIMYKSTRFVLLERNTKKNWQKLLRTSLSIPPSPPPLHKSRPQQRHILFDPQFNGYLSKEKLAYRMQHGVTEPNQQTQDPRRRRIFSR